MPGLVQLSSEQAVQVTLSGVGTDDRILGAGQRHRSLVRPNAFHVSIIFLPTFAFLDRVAEILPAGVDIANASSNILDEFVLKVYLPQLDEKVSTLFHQTITGACTWPRFFWWFSSPIPGSDAFQPDPLSTRLSPQPLVKVTTLLLRYACFSLLFRQARS